MLKIEKIDTLPAFQSLKEEWDALLKKYPRPSIFLTWDWLFCWWKYFGQKKSLQIILVRDERDNLLGLAPLFATKERWGMKSLKVIKFLGTQPISSEYLDFICEKDVFTEVAKEILSYLIKNKNSDLLFFSDLRADSALLQSLRQYPDLAYRVEEGETCPFIAFPAEWETYFKSVNRRVREYVKANANFFLQEEKGELKKADESDYQTVLQELFRLHTQRWQSKGKSGSFALAEKRDFHLEISRRLLEKKELGLYYLRVDKKIASVLYGFVYQDTYYFYQTGFDLSFEGKKPGLLVLYHALQDSFRSGLRNFDFLRGEEEYKLKWANSRNQTFHALLPLTNQAKLALQIRKSYRGLKREVKTLLKKSS